MKTVQKKEGFYCYKDSKRKANDGIVQCNACAASNEQPLVSLFVIKDIGTKRVQA